MSATVSKNMYELLGNDPELDPDRPADPPVKVADKPAPRAGKRNAGAEAPAKDTAKPATGGRGGRNNDGATGSEQAFRDRTAGAANNRSRPVDDGVRQDRHPDRVREQGDGRGRGSRGGRGRGGRGGARGPRDDRQSHSNIGEHEKQAAHGWGAETAEGELADETAAVTDARTEEKDGIVADSTVPVDENGTPADELPAEEDKTMSYEQYLAQQLEKKAALGAAPLEVRKANEGSSKKFPEGKAFSRGDASAENFIAGSGGKAKRERERKAKNTLDIDQAWIEPAESGGAGRGEGSRGGRGGRGGRGRGEGGFRGEGRGRGGRGGARGGESRGPSDRPSAPRGGRGTGATPNITDSQAFPSLGA